MAGISNSQVERLNVFLFLQRDDQYHEPGTNVPLHLWSMTNLGAAPLANFNKLISRTKTLLADRGITKYILNYGPLYAGSAYFILEKYEEPIAEANKNTLFSLNYSNAEAEAEGAIQFGIVLWLNFEHPPVLQITYNPNFFNPQDGIEVPPELELGPEGENIAAVVPVNGPNMGVAWGNLAGGDRSRRSFRRRRTHKKRRSLRKRASRRS